jgi:hypothetical protein
LDLDESTNIEENPQLVRPGYIVVKEMKWT